MKKVGLNAGWKLSRPGGIFEKFGEGPCAESVDLPYDAMIYEERREDSPNGPDAGWYDGGTYIYTKELMVSQAWKGRTLILEFEGVSANASYFINGQYLGKCPYAYSKIKFEISQYVSYGESNEIKVIAKTGMQQVGRWYMGAGILRPVWLMVGAQVELIPDTLRLTTVRCSVGEAYVECSVKICQQDLMQQACDLEFTLMDCNGNIAAADTQKITLFGREERTGRAAFWLANPMLWNVDTPNLYRLKAVIRRGGETIDQDEITTGIRQITIDPAHGLRINGVETKLRGGCIHHDQGLLGGIALKDAETRRIRRLKAAGFNAVRSAHNPASRELLEACDEEGMLVMDELFDVWNESKRDHDYSLYFDEWWEQDMQSAVEKNYNHPSVIMCSIGNEIPETGTAYGARLCSRMAGYFRSLDPTRPVVNCINGMFSVMPQMRAILAEVLGEETEIPTDINALMSMFDANIDEIMRHPVVTHATEETFAGVDICGYNYMPSRYVMDHSLFPNRVIVGSETNPDKIGYHWPLILENSHVIGDFCWTAWDYIGEAGVGKNDYDMTHEMYGPWPWYLAYCGDFDMIGNRRPQSYYREIVFGYRNDPYIAVERPRYYNCEKITSNWTWSDVVECWTWPGFEGKRTHVEVYSKGDLVELFLNGESLEIRPLGQDFPYRAVFDVEYQPGTLTAVAYQDGERIGSYTVSSVGKAAKIMLEAEQATVEAGRNRLAYVNVALVDEVGNVCVSDETEIALEISGNARLRGFGSANPKSTESFHEQTTKTFDGRALAIVSSAEPGEVTLKATADGLEPGCVTIYFEQER